MTLVTILTFPIFIHESEITFYRIVVSRDLHNV